MMRNERDKPTIHLVAGPNGAGKTTFALTYLRDVGVRDFINADMIARGISPLDPAAAQVEAGRIFLKLLEEKIALREDFAFETTLSGRTYLRKISSWRRAGWRVVVHFLWIPSSEFSMRRVRERVEQGGHDIPVEDIKRRYARVMRNLGELGKICDDVVCYDNTRSERAVIFSVIDGEMTIENASLYAEIVKNFEA